MHSISKRIESFVLLTIFSVFLAAIPLSGCTTKIVADEKMSAQVTYFPQQGKLDFRGNMEAVIAGQLIIENGCFAMSTNNVISTILWHPNAKLNEDRRSVVDTNTGRTVKLNENFALVGGMLDSEPIRSLLISKGTMPQKCITNRIIQVGIGFYSE